MWGLGVELSGRGIAYNEKKKLFMVGLFAFIVYPHSNLLERTTPLPLQVCF